MEAGYDWLLVRGRWQRRPLRVAGFFLLFLGMLLLAGSGGYFGYAGKARADLAKLNVAVSGIAGVSPGSGSELVSELAGLGQRLTAVGEVSEGWPIRELASDPLTGGGAATISAEVAAPLEVTLAGMPTWALASQRLYPGELLGARAWSNPLAYEPAGYVAQTLLRGFTPINSSHAYPLGSQLPLQRLILVPDVAIDSPVIPLRIQSLGDSRAYETPYNAVGHIPESANPGEQGSAWLFGHLESPLLGGGSVFYDLPKVPGLLRQGKDVYIIADNGTRQYLYQVTLTRVVPQEDLKLTSTNLATIHLVTCVPRLVYDHRLIVSGQLVGVK